jgi:rubredoxin
MTQQKLVYYDCFFCDACRRYVYDESLGDVDRGISPRTPVTLLPTSWQCPECGASKEQLRAVTLCDGFSYEEAVHAKEQAL